jgi:hypothetical protein
MLTFFGTPLVIGLAKADANDRGTDRRFGVTGRPGSVTGLVAPGVVASRRGFE